MSDLEAVNPIKDESNPKSVINLVPTALSTRIKAIPDEIFDFTVGELEEAAKVTEIERKIRVAFWLEYERALRTGTVISMANCYRGICLHNNFMKHVITNSLKLAYILQPPEDYRVALEEMLMVALKAEREVLQTPIKTTRVVVKGDGEQKVIESVDAQLAMVHHKIRESIQNRLQGMPVHRSMQLTHSTNVNHNVVSGVPEADKGFSQEELASMGDGKLQELVEQLKAENGPRAMSQPIDVTPKKAGG